MKIMTDTRREDGSYIYPRKNNRGLMKTEDFFELNSEVAIWGLFSGVDSPFCCSLLQKDMQKELRHY
jgi:hypothetical protein